jgi:hypothetical protein
MSKLSILVSGNQSPVAGIYQKYGIAARQGHTVIEFEPGTEQARTAAAVFSELTTLYRFTGLATTVADNPTRIERIDPEAIMESEYVLIPQIAGGA